MDRTEETDLARALRRLDVAGDMAAMDKQTLAEYRDTIRDLRAELSTLRAEATAVVSGLVERIERNGGLGEYKGGKPFILGDARTFLAKTEPEV